MKSNSVVFAFWAVIGGAAAQDPAFSVRMYNYAEVPQDTLEKATQEAQRVLGVTAFKIHWLECALREDQVEARHLPCKAPMTDADILLRIVPRSMQPERGVAHALGYALPLVGQPPTRAYVLYDRVREKIRKCNGISEFRLLGYVMAHEVAHLLFKNDRHHRRGIMMASWQEKDLVEIERGTLAFSQQEVSLLETGGIARMLANRPDEQTDARAIAAPTAAEGIRSEVAQARSGLGAK
jgi:hypothetical protein